MERQWAAPRQATRGESPRSLATDARVTRSTAPAARADSSVDRPDAILFDQSVAIKHVDHH